ncbi:MAG: helix-turn-helix domain-containing protein, partial [Chloroflexota bacterium]
IGAGIGIGNLMGQALQGGMQQQPQQQQQASNGNSTSNGGTPDVMTPSEAAAILRVSEEDVMAAITSGDLKAKKLGNAYRISKGSLEEFLKS